MAARVATRELQVPPPDDTGLVQHANELPLDEVGAGPYKLRVHRLGRGGHHHPHRTVRIAALVLSRGLVHVRHRRRVDNAIAGRFSSTGAAAPCLSR